MDKQGVLSWPNPSPETVLFFSGRVEPPHDSQDDLRDDLSVNSLCRTDGEDDRDEVFGRAWIMDQLSWLLLVLFPAHFFFPECDLSSL